MADDDNAAQVVAHRTAVDKAATDEAITDETASDDALSQKEQLNNICTFWPKDGRIEIVRVALMAVVSAGIPRKRHTFACLILQGKQKPLMSVFSGYSMRVKPEPRVLPNRFWTEAGKFPITCLP